MSYSTITDRQLVVGTGLPPASIPHIHGTVFHDMVNNVSYMYSDTSKRWDLLLIPYPYFCPNPCNWFPYTVSGCPYPFAGPECTECVEGLMGELCTECVKGPGWDPATQCTTCLPGFTGSNCDEPVDPGTGPEEPGPDPDPEPEPELEFKI